jgi:hypothetical protein
MTEFYQGKPCKRGHEGKRYKSTGACVECMPILKAAFRQRKAQPNLNEELNHIGIRTG